MSQNSRNYSVFKKPSNLQVRILQISKVLDKVIKYVLHSDFDYKANILV